MDSLAPILSDLLGSENVARGTRVARYTTWRVGGAVPLLAVVHDAAALARSVAAACAAGMPWLVLGRGSNVLVDDAGVDAVVIVNRAAGLTIEGAAVRAESGALLSVLARQTVGAGLVGLEWCHDIPGSVGGAVVNNAGANGGCMADVLRRVRVLPAGPPDRATAEASATELDAAELAFGYRRSVLREEEAAPARMRPVVLEAFFALQYGEVGEIKRRMVAQRARRKATQPGGASAGSVFKNPPGDSAGRLVESVGLKGARAGDATISTLHANFIVAGPRARAADVLVLVALARRRVREEYGIVLEPEVQFVWRDGRIGPPPLEEL